MSTLFNKPSQRWAALQASLKAESVFRERFAKIRSMIEGEDKAPTNVGWEYLTLVLPQLAWKNPSLLVESSIAGEAAYDAIGLQYALQVLMDEQRLSSEWEQIFADSLAWRGVSMVTTGLNYAPRYVDGLKLVAWDGKVMTPEGSRELEIPRLIRIDPTDFVCDSEALSPSRARFMAHSWDAYVEDLDELSEAGESWNMDRIHELSGRNLQGEDERESLKVWEMFVPGKLDAIALDEHEGPEDPESMEHGDLYNGTVYTMAHGSDGGLDVRKPRLYRGPRCGPYGVYSGSPIPGRGTRLAPLMAVYNQINEATRKNKALSTSVDAYKRIVLTAFREYQEAIQDAANDGIVSLEISGQLLKDAIKEVTIGGPSKELIDAVNIDRTNLDEALGLSQTKKGIAQSGTTATAEAIADKAGDMRLAMHREGVQRTACEQVWVMGWHIDHTVETEIALPPAALTEALKKHGVEGMDTAGDVAVYRGGRSLMDAKGVRPGSLYANKSIRFQPLSMERTSEGSQQRRAMQALEAVQLIASLPPDLPRDQIAEDHGRRMNIQGLGDYFKGASAPVAPGGDGSQGVADPAGGPLEGGSSGARAFAEGV